MMLNYLLLWDYMGGWQANHRAKAREMQMRFANHPVAEQDAFRRAMARPQSGKVIRFPVKRRRTVATGR